MIQAEEPFKFADDSFKDLLKDDIMLANASQATKRARTENFGGLPQFQSQYYSPDVNKGRFYSGTRHAYEVDVIKETFQSNRQYKILSNGHQV